MHFATRLFHLQYPSAPGAILRRGSVAGFDAARIEQQGKSPTPAVPRPRTEELFPSVTSSGTGVLQVCSPNVPLLQAAVRSLADLRDVPWEKGGFKYLDAKSQSVPRCRKGKQNKNEKKTTKNKNKGKAKKSPPSMDFACNFWFADKLFKQVQRGSSKAATLTGLCSSLLLAHQFGRFSEKQLRGSSFNPNSAMQKCL